MKQKLLKAKSYEKKGEFEQAQKLYQAVLCAFPKNKGALQGLTALNTLKRTTSRQVPTQETINQLIDIYKQGQVLAVIEQATILTKQYPRAFILWNILGAANKEIGRVARAYEAFKKVTELSPTYAGAYYNMGIMLQEQGKLEEAIKAYNNALAIKPDYTDVYYNMGIALQDQVKLEEAIEAYKKALAIKPDYIEAYYNMGIILQEQGKLEEAIEAYNNALAIKPDYINAHDHLSRLIKYTSNNLQINTVNDLLLRPNLDESDQCKLHYIYAKMKEDLGDLGVAYNNYLSGGKLKKKLLYYDFKQDEIIFHQIKMTAPKVKELCFNEPIEVKSPAPIFILGMPRSGTTLIEQIVSSHSQVHGAGELTFLSRLADPLNTGDQIISSDSTLKLRKNYLNELENISHGKPFVTDKMPQNFLYIGIILKVLPEAKVIHVKRDPAATCWSNFKHHFSSEGLGFSYNLNDTIHYFKMYQELMESWKKQYGSQIYNLDYDRLTIEQEPETRKLIEHLGLDWEDVCLSPQKNKRSVKTASQQQVREKVYIGSSQDWRKFEPYLNGVFDEFEPTSTFLPS